MNNLIKTILIILAVGFGVHKIMNSQSNTVPPLYEKPYVAVYGRDNCGYTKRMIKNLNAANVNYKYFIVDKTHVADSLHSRMKDSGISTRRYNLPMVDVNGSISERPDFKDVLGKYNESL